MYTSKTNMQSPTATAVVGIACVAARRRRRGSSPAHLELKISRRKEGLPATHPNAYPRAKNRRPRGGPGGVGKTEVAALRTKRTTKQHSHLATECRHGGVVPGNTSDRLNAGAVEKREEGPTECRSSCGKEAKECLRQTSATAARRQWSDQSGGPPTCSTPVACWRGPEPGPREVRARTTLIRRRSAGVRGIGR